ncbi:MAG: hypothetical protein ACFBWO_12050 [Paracoccaceae bacterium]
MGIEHIVIFLFLFTLGGGLIHAYLNKRKTEELHAQHTTTNYSIPQVYQTCTDNRQCAIGLNRV